MININPHSKIAFIGYSGYAFVCIETAQAMNLDILGYHEFVEASNNPYNLSFLDIEEKFEQHDALLFGRKHGLYDSDCHVQEFLFEDFKENS